MASVYVYSGAAGAGTGADWANAYTTLQAAFAAKAAGDDFWVAHDHAQTQASALTLTPPGTAASPNRVICVNRAGSVPPVSADLRDPHSGSAATITTTGANAITIGGGFAYLRGLTLSAASGATNAGIGYVSSANGAWLLDKCKLVCAGTTGTAAKLNVGSTATGDRQKLEMRATTVQFGATTDSFVIRNIDFIWRDTPSAVAGATLPTTLFGNNQMVGGAVLLEGVDLSALGSGKTLVAAMGAPKKFFLKDCKLGGSVTIAAAQLEHGGAEVYLIRCDSSDTNYRQEKYRYEGTLTTETTIVRTGGASDDTTPASRKVVTTANAKRYLPFEAFPVMVWNETVGSPITITVEAIASAVWNTDEAWIEAGYLGTSGFPISSFATSGVADILATGAANTTSTETWGGVLTGKFKMAVTITPQEKGWIAVTPKFGKASGTVYYDHEATVS